MDNQQIKLIEDVNEALVVSIGGDNFIDANLLAETIKDFVSLIEYSKREISPTTNIELKVEAFQPGSFTINFCTIFDTLGSDKASNIAIVAGTIITAITGIISIAKFIMGKKPLKTEKDDEKGTIEITNSEGVQITVNQQTYNIYAAPDCNTTIAEMFDRLEMDGSRKDIRVTTRETEEVVEAKDFKSLSRPTSLETINDNISIQNFSKISLAVRKPDLTGNSQWTFYFNKHINAVIEDRQFLELVHNGKYHFGANDELIVDLRMETILDDRGLPEAGSERYFIEHVYRFVPFIDSLTEDQISIDDLRSL